MALIRELREHIATLYVAPDQRIKYGRRYVLVETTQETGSISCCRITEGLLCEYSTYFRNKLQRNRKAIEGDCSICYQALLPGVKELTFCVHGCGQNFHYDCITPWVAKKEEKGDASDIDDNERDATCPYCRAEWIQEYIGTIRVKDLMEFDSEAFGIYVRWLKHKDICINTDMHGNPKHVQWLKAYVLGDQIQDSYFCKAVLKAALILLKKGGYYPGPASAEYAYKQMTCESPLRKLLVNAYAMVVPSERIDTIRNEYPLEFLEDLQKVTFERRDKPVMWDAEAMQKDLFGDAQEEGDSEVSLSLGDGIALPFS